jgi:hypothetical protein
MVVLVVAMGIAIIAGSATLAVLLIRRGGAPAPVVALAAPVAAAEPEGSHIAGIAAVGDRLAVFLTGGGADRVLFLDPRTATVAGRFSLGK